MAKGKGVGGPTAAFNGVNRGVYIADNLDFLRAINSGSVDLVCIDPPFAKNDTFTADMLKPPLTGAEKENELRLLEGQWGIATPEQADAAGIAWPEDPKARGGYRDTWDWDMDVHPDWQTDLEHHHPAVNKLIDTTRDIQGDDVAAYLAFMAIRLVEIHRVLKPAGILFLHCDHTADGYLRQLLDGIFGKDNFRNAIAWKRTNAPTASKYQFGCVHDTIFAYAKSAAAIFNPVFVPHSQEYLDKSYRHKDERGIFRASPLTAQGATRGSSGQPWGGVDVAAKGLHWVVPQAIPEDVVKPANFSEMKTQEKLDWLDREGLIYWPPRGKVPAFKRYLHTTPGARGSDLIVDIAGIQGSALELTGYPTQKPIALAERIIQAATKPGDMVLDCFAGCAYAAVAAEKLGRQWAACDINPRAWTVFKRQFNKGGDLPKLTCNDRTTGQQVMGSEPTVTVHGPGELPRRTTPRIVEIKPLRTNNRRAGGNVPEGKRERPLMSKPEILKELLDFTDGKAYCCGFESKNGDGSYAYGDYELDHIIPKSVGGPDDITNRQPLCPTHNQLKRDLDLDLKELRALVGERQEYKAGCNSRTLPRPDRIAEYAREVYIRYYRLRRGEGLR